MCSFPILTSIIPYQEQLGNYNELYDTEFVYQIIPYQEQLGNYNHSPKAARLSLLYHTKNN